MADAKVTDTRHGLHLRAVAWLMAALGVTVLVCAGIAFLVWRNATSTPRLLAPNAPREFDVKGVALETTPRSAYADYAAEKDRLLHAREWIDADAGIARIPIDAAMRVLAEQDAKRRAAATAVGPTR